MDWKTSRNHVVENWSEIRRGYCDGLVVGADVVEALFGDKVSRCSADYIEKFIPGLGDGNSLSSLPIGRCLYELAFDRGLEYPLQYDDTRARLAELGVEASRLSVLRQRRAAEKSEYEDFINWMGQTASSESCASCLALLDNEGEDFLIDYSSNEEGRTNPALRRRMYICEKCAKNLVGPFLVRTGDIWSYTQIGMHTLPDVGAFLDGLLLGKAIIGQATKPIVPVEFVGQLATDFSEVFARSGEMNNSYGHEAFRGAYPFFVALANCPDNSADYYKKPFRRDFMDLSDYFSHHSGDSIPELLRALVSEVVSKRENESKLGDELPVELRTMRSEGYLCDRCGQSHSVGQARRTSLLISFTGGFASIFGDGEYFRGVLCQQCTDELFIVPFGHRMKSAEEVAEVANESSVSAKLAALDQLDDEARQSFHQAIKRR